jgi:hypothetical protein
LVGLEEAVAPGVPENKNPVGGQMNNYGCESLHGLGYRDGETVPKVGRPARISVELRTKRLKIGSEVEGPVRLNNTGSEAIENPWTDYRTTKTGQDSSDRQWEAGLVRIPVRSKPSGQVRLGDLSQVLLAAPRTGSKPTIRPGERI